ncbi:MAG: type VI secretion system tube protein Hcp [Pseudomonadota bacterium]
MSVDMFLKLEGIAGESEDNDHTGENDVLAWSWNVSQNGTMHVGGGGGAGKANFGDVTISKFVDKGSVSLLQACAKGTHIPKGRIIVRKAGDKPLEFVQFDMEEILISMVSPSCNGSSDRMTETLSLNFRQWKMTYTPQTKDGTGGGAVEFGFNIAKNVAA